MNNCCPPSPPACPSTVTTESVASQLQNLITTLLGTFTVTVVNGRAVWSAPCSAATAGLSCFPILPGEGFVCYFLRILTTIGLFSGGTWSASTSYCANTVVGFNGSLYVALQNTLGNQPGVSPAFWQLLLTAPQGLQGPQGNQGVPGTGGGGSTVNYSTRVVNGSATASNTDAVIFCQPSGAMPVTIPAGSTLLSGKWFTLVTTGAFNVTITMTGSDTINGAATYVMKYANEAVTMVQNGTSGVWSII